MPQAHVCAVIVAGGAGTRFGNPGGKLLVDVAGRPLMSWSLLAFDAAETVESIVVVCPPDHRDEMCERAIDPLRLSVPVTFAASGKTRQDSTRSGIFAAPAGTTHVAIHDAARPLIEPATIDGAVHMLLGHPDADGVVCGQPAIDTLKVVADGAIEGTPDRSAYWCVQTPQVFSLAKLTHAFELADATGFVGTDDASVVEHAGGRVLCANSPRDNLKVTVPEDLVLVSSLMRYRLQKDQKGGAADHVE